MEPIPLDELKSEKCPRISAEDLIELGELMGTSPSRSPTKRSKASKPKIVIVDVRTSDEYPLLYLAHLGTSHIVGCFISEHCNLQ